MSNSRVVIIGLPESGKTTFLAALWHVVTSFEIETALRFHELGAGNKSHLNNIARRWRDAEIQDRTAVGGGRRIVDMNLKDQSNQPLRVSFPDFPGEVYRQIWEDRQCDPEVAEILRNRRVLLFVHADTIQQPRWVMEEVTLSRELEIPIVDIEKVEWHPQLAPTQVQLVDLLQLLHTQPLDVGPRRLAVMLSAWDKVVREGMTPVEYMNARLPLLAQYLRANADGWAWQIFGLSAQGGDYDSIDHAQERRDKAAELRSLDRPSTRISVVIDSLTTHDLTEPLAWLMQG